MTMEIEYQMQRGGRWRWALLGLLPGLLSSLMFGASLLTDHVDSVNIKALGTGLACGAVLLPLAAPVYLSEVGRRYVRAVHGGFTSRTPFVVMYCCADAVLWFAGMMMVLAQIGYR